MSLCFHYNRLVSATRWCNKPRFTELRLSYRLITVIRKTQMIEMRSNYIYIVHYVVLSVFITIFRQSQHKIINWQQNPKSSMCKK